MLRVLRGKEFPFFLPLLRAGFLICVNLRNLRTVGRWMLGVEIWHNTLLIKETKNLIAILSLTLVLT